MAAAGCRRPLTPLQYGMPNRKPFAGHRHEVSRLEGFSDAVFAFAVTLLVVSLEVPRTFSELAMAMREFPAFAICFALLFQVWWRHFNFFRRYGLEDRVTIILTSMLLFVVLFYVYPLKFVFKLVLWQMMGLPLDVKLADGTTEPMIVPSQAGHLMQIYSLGVVAVFGLFALLYAHAYRQRDELALNASDALDTRVEIIDNVGIAAIGVLSLLIATFGGPLASAVVAGPIYFLIGPFKFGLGAYGRKAHARLDAITPEP
jgi:uncharacterized membrane protein